MSLLDGDTVNVWKYIDLRIDPDPFCTSCQTSTINGKVISKKPLNIKTTFTWVFIDIIPSISSKILTKDTTFSNDLLIVDAYFQIPKMYGMVNITT